jgi:hypothetical protein
VADEPISPATPAPPAPPSSSSPSPSPPAAASPPANGSPNTTPKSDPPSPSTPKVDRPDWLPESHWDATANTIKPEFGAHYKELAGFKASEDSRRLTLPQKPEEYDFALPKDFKPPEGIEFQLNPQDPLAAEARKFAIEAGLSKEQFSKLLAIHAAGQIGSVQAINNAKAAEVQKLGVNGPARKTAVDTFIASVPGVSADDAKAFSNFMFTAAQVQVMEKIMAHMRSQGVAPMRPNPDAPAPRTISDAEWDKMSYAARKDYAAQQDQQRFTNGA